VQLHGLDCAPQGAANPGLEDKATMHDRQWPHKQEGG